MAYTPPSPNNVELVIETGYTPPDSSNVELILYTGEEGVEYTISLSDIIQLSHADKKDLSLYPQEALNLSEKLINRLELALFSTIALSEDLTKSLSIICRDDITISELSKLSLVASLITDILLSENVKRDTKVKILSLLRIDEKIVSYLGLIPHEERMLYSLIVLSKLLNSDINILKEIISLIKEEEEASSRIERERNSYSLIKDKEEV